MPDLDELEELAQQHGENQGSSSDNEEQEEEDPERRMREDVADMGL